MKDTFNKIKTYFSTHKLTKQLLLIFFGIVVVCAIISAILCFSKTQNTSETEFYIYPNTTYQQLCDSLEAKNIVNTKHFAFKTYSKVFSLKQNIKTGYYIIDKKMPVLKLVKHLRNGEQEPIRVTITYARSVDEFANLVTKKLLMTKEDLLKEIDSLGYEYPTMVYCDVLPDTYEFYWTVSVKDLLKKLKKYADRWWNKKEKDLEKSGFSRTEIVTLASIVNEETNYEKEKKRIAGVYVNRLKIGQALQADPTVKFALGDFSIRRITSDMLKTDSPFNTYKVTGLPPAPICIPTISSLKAALKYEKHDYYYFCAKEDFSGSHNFAKTFEQHQKNAKKYHKALNARNIK